MWSRPTDWPTANARRRRWPRCATGLAHLRLVSPSHSGRSRWLCACVRALARGTFLTRGMRAAVASSLAACKPTLLTASTPRFTPTPLPPHPAPATVAFMMLSFAFPTVAPVRPCMSAGGSGGGPVGGGSGPIPRGRLGEFASAGGDHVAQDALVHELMWQAAQLGLTEDIEGKIAEFDAGANELLTGLFGRRERDIIARNEQLGRRAALADRAEWNVTWRAGRRESAQIRREISDELAQVNKLLLSAQAKKRGGAKWRRRRRRPANGSDTVHVSGDVLAVKRRPRRLLPSVAVVGFVTSMCLHNVSTFASGHDTQHLTRTTFATAALALMGVYSHALYKLVEEEWRRLR